MTTRQLLKKDVLAYLNMLDRSYEHKTISINEYIHVRLKYPVLKVVFCMRFCNALEKCILVRPIYLILKMRFRHLQIKYGIQTGHRLNPGGGFFVGHFGGIVIHESTQIGENLILHQNTSIGTTDMGVPRIGNNVTIGANVCIIGDVEIGDNCTIGAGAVVTRSFDKNSIIAGNPARKIGEKTEGAHKF